MKVTITFENDSYEDGFDGQALLLRNGVETVHDLLNFYTEAARIAGFIDVDRVGYSTSKGAQTWSSF